MASQPSPCPSHLGRCKGIHPGAIVASQLNLLFKSAHSSRARHIALGLLWVTTFLLALHLVSWQEWLPSTRPALRAKAMRPSKALEPSTHGDLRDERSRVGKVAILYGGEKWVYERALRTHKIHNRLHGYPMFIQREPMLDGYWTKPAHILSTVLHELAKPKHERLLWLFWIDADTVILSYKSPLEVFLPLEDDRELEDINVLTTNDWNGLNNGIFAIRVSQYAVELLPGILVFRDYRPHVPLRFQDQSAMEFVLKQRKFAKHAITVPQRWFNAYPSHETDRLQKEHVRPGDLFVHFPGIGNREAVMARWCDVSEQLDSAWNIPLERTPVPQEVFKFWKEFKERRRIIPLLWTESTALFQAVAQNASQIVVERKGNAALAARVRAVQQAQEKAERMLKAREKVLPGDLTLGDLNELETLTTDLERTIERLIAPKGEIIVSPPNNAI